MPLISLKGLVTFSALLAVASCLPKQDKLHYDSVTRKLTSQTLYDGNDDSAVMSFVVMGDWGGESHDPYTTTAQVAVAEAAGSVAANLNAQFVLNVGDNFYKHGIPTDCNDPRFQETFVEVYTASSLQVPWITMAGNHDWEGNVTAQIAYSALNSIWNFPSLYYTYSTSATIAGDLTTFEFVIFDSVTAAGDWTDADPQPVGAPDQDAADAQQVFIQNALSNSTADWLFLTSHYPVYSTGAHGNTESFVSFLPPLMTQYGVAAYFNGHEHNGEHFVVNGNSYFICGGGHLLTFSQNYPYDVPSGDQLFYYPPSDMSSDGVHGLFASVTILNKTTASLTYYLDDQSVLYSTYITNPRVNGQPPSSK